MEVYKLHSTLLRLLIIYLTIKVAAVFSVTFVQNSDEETNLMFHEPAVHHRENARESELSSRFSNLRKSVKRDRSHSDRRSRRAIIVRCCGMDTCSPTASRQHPSSTSNFLAYAKLTFDGVSISCPNCPKGWEGNLKWSWTTKGIPIVCKDCPHNWEYLLSINEGATTLADTTDEEETDETDATDETEEPTTVKGKKTTVKVTTKASVTVATTVKVTNTTVATTQTTKPITNSTVTATTPVGTNTITVENATTTTKAATTAAASGGGGLSFGGFNLGSLGGLLG